MSTEDFQKAISNKSTLLYWDEPWAGIDKNGKATSPCVTSCASAGDCIQISRRETHRVLGAIALSESNESMLMSFIDVHWAYLKPREPVFAKSQDVAEREV